MAEQLPKHDLKDREEQPDFPLWLAASLICMLIIQGIALGRVTEAWTSSSIWPVAIYAAVLVLGALISLPSRLISAMFVCLSITTAIRLSVYLREIPAENFRVEHVMASALAVLLLIAGAVFAALPPRLKFS